MEKLRMEDQLKQMRISKVASTCVVKEVLQHFQKAHIITIQEHKMCEKIDALHTEYCSLKKLNPERREKSGKVLQFRSKLKTTMPFWPRDVLARMEKSKFGRTVSEVEAIVEDIAFLDSQMTDREAISGT
jgi:hypothetical protein